MTRVDERMLVACIVALLTLTALSFGVSYLHLPSPWEVIVALAIAVLKVLLVLFFFMRVIEASASVKLVILIVPLFVLLFVGLVIGDVSTRLTHTENAVFRRTTPLLARGESGR